MEPNTGFERTGVSEGSQHQGPYRFNTEELRVLKQCNRESFYQRSLPISTVLSIGTYYAVKCGYLKNHPRFGPTPKVLIAATIGYFVGKFSYQSKCAEKLMQLSNSPIGEMLRQRKHQSGNQEPVADQSSLSWPDMGSESDAVQTLDSERPMTDAFDSYRPLDSPSFEEETTTLGAPTQTTTYEELRRKNREEFENKKSSKSYRSSLSEEPLSSSASPPAEKATMGRNKPKNKYGDVLEE